MPFYLPNINANVPPLRKNPCCSGFLKISRILLAPGSQGEASSLCTLLFQLCLVNTGEPAGSAGVWISSFKAQYFGLLEFTYKTNILQRPGGQPHFLSLDVISLKKKTLKKKKKKPLLSAATARTLGSTAYCAGAEPAARPQASDTSACASRAGPESAYSQ